MVVEIWKDVVGFEGLYQVSDLGNVRSLDRFVDRKVRVTKIRGQEMKKCKVPTGYLTVKLSDGVRGHFKLIQGLVLESFVGARPKGMQACHNDGVRDNNELPNLRWDTPKSNAADKILHGTHQCGTLIGNSKLSDLEVIEIKRRLALERDIWGSGKKIASDFGVSPQTITYIKSGKTWNHL